MLIVWSFLITYTYFNWLVFVKLNATDRALMLFFGTHAMPTETHCGC